ncbi:MAG: hypothetical protein M3O22_00460 [Pseudomonadota bacterium]|nr:hypothetical protein [Pseudomonadota bacterium]
MEQPYRAPMHFKKFSRALGRLVSGVPETAIEEFRGKNITDAQIEALGKPEEMQGSPHVIRFAETVVRDPAGFSPKLVMWAAAGLLHVEEIKAHMEEIKALERDLKRHGWGDRDWTVDRTAGMETQSVSGSVGKGQLVRLPAPSVTGWHSGNGSRRMELVA